MFGKQKIKTDNTELKQLWQQYKNSIKALQTKEPFDEQGYLVIDCETSGLDLKNDDILSIAWLPVDNLLLSIADSQELYVKHETFGKKASTIHGILEDDIRTGVMEQDALIALLNAAKGRVIVGHHIGFDMAMINRQLNVHFGVKMINPILDSMTLFQRAFPIKTRYYSKNAYEQPAHYSLDNVAQEFEIETHDRHSAIGDVYITGIAFLRLVKILKKQGVHTLKQLLKD